MKRLLLLLTFTVVGFMITINASAKTIVTDGLVSYWTFDRKTMYDKQLKMFGVKTMRQLWEIQQ